VPIVLKSGNLNLLEPSGPVQACNGIALHLPLTLIVSVIVRINLHMNTCIILIGYRDTAVESPDLTLVSFLFVGLGEERSLWGWVKSEVCEAG